ncbi:MAG: hypothetical protein COV29_04130 [Candidatus Yanofskybacteria bacterium CG10_big_fil_rev_8_21_14_0_10_36_16]|uniref:Uncharacterized protein n=1 Tax=Candidatus Yanofskybacteria bacterium CG10_big_fil_rev_8_21_14_0_10_36_16 TaxID=1975096 RepID=A0A2J0Q6S2_9BACT|nr:MAG: hypothetical protein COV29_04130 [Candidatus Yanofskybacteria bacterium CG10_big_fil_rev_8_21_14_0_10_36_16]
MSEQPSVKGKTIGIIAVLIGVLVLVFFVFTLIKNGPIQFQAQKYEIPRFAILSENAEIISEKERAYAGFELEEEPTSEDLDGIKFEETISYYRQQLPKNNWNIEIDKTSGSGFAHQFYARNSKDGLHIFIKRNVKNGFIITKVTVQRAKYDPKSADPNRDFEVHITDPKDIERIFGTPPINP